MIVYVESNFILELAYLQEEHENCERILKLAEAKKIRLVVPAFALAEPFSAWVGRKRRRVDLHKNLTNELRELGRSKPYAESREEFQEITKALLVSGEDEKLRLDAVIERLVAVAALIPIEGETVRSAIEIQKTRRLEPQDSIVYASVLSDLPGGHEEQRCFVTKNSKDFANPDITQDLASYQCELITNFGAAYGYVLKQL
jgi:predicted nucleic acid-binding protein